MSLNLTQLAKAGFNDLSLGRDKVEQLSQLTGIDSVELLEALSRSADPERAVTWAIRLGQSSNTSHKVLVKTLTDPVSRARLITLLGASRGLAEFLERHPASLALFAKKPALPQNQVRAQQQIEKALGSQGGYSKLVGAPARIALRVAYREMLLAVANWDLAQADARVHIAEVTAALTDIAGAALEGALQVARSELADTYPRDHIDLVDFAIIAMGKCGARELNYLSDVDVIYVAQSRDESILAAEKASELASKIARLVPQIINDAQREPGLWEVDANLRPEGKDGALVRTVESHRTYYERWAKDWEFQALLKARPVAGSTTLGAQYIAAVQPMVWSSAARENFVDQVQRMRERVTENIPADDVAYQIKLGPGGLRDIEFTVQLLQLVHGLTDESVRTQSTLDSLQRLSAGGYVGRNEATTFAMDYQFLRLLEHRVQLRDLTRTHLMPRDENEQRILARATGLFHTHSEVVESWHATKLNVRDLHERLFYRPLLAAVAQLGDDTLQLTSDQARARLAAIGFKDAQSALTHIAALTSGVSRRAAIQRTLLPVMLQWLSQGADPDYGLICFRRLSEELGESPWFLRMLRDSAGAAERLTRVLSGSHYVSDLMEKIPESAAWFDGDENLAPMATDALNAEIDAIRERHLTAGLSETEHAEAVIAARNAIRNVRRREVLRLAIAGIVNVGSMTEISTGLSAVTSAVLRGYLLLALAEDKVNPDFGIIAMGRFGGNEIGFGSDADVMYVYRETQDCFGEAAQKRAEQIVGRIADLAEDPRLPFSLDLDLRPEGKNGLPVRSLEGYAAYYERWSELWEAQALLRARPAAGTAELLAEMMLLIDTVRYPAEFSLAQIREIRRIKARVEKERLPQGADPLRHVKLGRGSLSDVEWTAQLLQLQHSAEHAELKTTSTLEVLRESARLSLISLSDAEKLTEAWILASRVRSAITLWSNKAQDSLPSDSYALDGIARLLGYPPHSASDLEEHYLAVTRRARQVFDRVFYGG